MSDEGVRIGSKKYVVIEESEDVSVRACQRVVVAECVQVVVETSNAVTVHRCRLDGLTDSILPGGRRVQLPTLEESGWSPTLEESGWSPTLEESGWSLRWYVVLVVAAFVGGVLIGLAAAGAI